MADFNRRLQVPAAQRGSAFVRRIPGSLDLIFALQFERTVNRDNTVSFQNLHLQIEPVGWRATLAGCMVIVHQHLDGTLSLTHGPRLLGRYNGEGMALKKTNTAAGEACGKDARRKSQTPTFPPSLEIPQTPRDSHFPTATITAG